jgi:hypothetical protein
VYIFIVFSTIIYPFAKKQFAGSDTVIVVARNYMVPTVSLLVVFGLWQLIVTSLLGIYFLTERIQSLTDAEN